MIETRLRYRIAHAVKREQSERLKQKGKPARTTAGRKMGCMYMKNKPR